MNNPEDPRNITTGREIPTSTYSDQPYVVKTDDGAWLCCVTTGVGHEGEPGQIVTTMRSTDRGVSWSEPVAVEPPDGPEASYAVMLKADSGRVYIFYNHNTDNIREIPADPGPWFPEGVCRRVDSLGHFVFKYSDDGGKSWSRQRYPIPVREFEIDRNNRHRGELRYFWNVGKPFTHDGAGFVSLHKVGGFGEGFFTSSEGVLLKSPNIMSEPDPRKIVWETLPDGDRGLRTPPGGGPIAEEQSYVVLRDGSFYVTYRTIDGYPVEAYSRDGGHTWTTPRYRRYANGRLMKHPRAANFVWKCGNGKYLYWFHNHGGRFIGEHPRRRSIAYEDRNPVWLSGGVEVDGTGGRELIWSQPEIVLYDDDPYVRMSYPDLVEEEGNVYLTETQKDQARVHLVDPTLLDGLWGQLSSDGAGGARQTGASPESTRAGLVLSLPGKGTTMPETVPELELPRFTLRNPKRADYGTLDRRAGITIELEIDLASFAAGEMLLDNRSNDGRGFCVRTAEGGTVEIVLSDGRTESRWSCDPGLISAGTKHRVVIIVDGGPKVILFVVDGLLCDGGDFRQFGFGRYNRDLRGVDGCGTLRIGGTVASLRIYDRALRVSEVIADAK